MTALRADQPLGLPESFGFPAGLVIPGRVLDDLRGADQLARCVVVLMRLFDIESVVDRGGYSERASYFESTSASAITSEASRDFGTSTPERLISQTMLSSRS